MFFEAELTEWEREILRRAKEVWQHGEGAVTFRVSIDQGRKQWKMETTRVNRGEENA